MSATLSAAASDSRQMMLDCQMWILHWGVETLLYFGEGIFRLPRSSDFSKRTHAGSNLFCTSPKISWLGSARTCFIQTSPQRNDGNALLLWSQTILHEASPVDPKRRRSRLGLVLVRRSESLLLRRPFTGFVLEFF